MADAVDLKSAELKTREGSTPSPGKFTIIHHYQCYMQLEELVATSESGGRFYICKSCKRKGVVYK